MQRCKEGVCCRPHHRTTASRPRSEDGSAPPCGPDCWRAAQQHGSQPSALACASPAAGPVSPAAGRAPGSAPREPKAEQGHAQPLPPGALPDNRGVAASSTAGAAQDHAESPQSESRPALAGPEAAGTAQSPGTGAAAAHISSPRIEEGLTGLWHWPEACSRVCPALLCVLIPLSACGETQVTSSISCAGVKAEQPAAGSIDRAALASVPSRKRKRRSGSAGGEGSQGEPGSASTSSAGLRGATENHLGTDAVVWQGILRKAELPCCSVAPTLFDLSALIEQVATRCAPMTLQPWTRQPQPQVTSGQPLRCATSRLGCCARSTKQPCSACFALSGVSGQYLSSSQLGPPALADVYLQTLNGGFMLSSTAVGAALRRDHAQGRPLPHIAPGGQPHLRAGARAHPAGPAARSAYAVHSGQPAAALSAQAPEQQAQARRAPAPEECLAGARPS